MTRTATGSAPGRVNLIGEHTDYNEGHVLPLAIPQRTTVDAQDRADDQVHVRSEGMIPAAASFRVGGPPAETWAIYVQAAVWALGEAGYPVRGFDADVRSEVPVGSGLSSSAALLVALLRTLRTLWGLPYDDGEMVQLAHRAETAFVGVPVGILDHMACTFAESDVALFLDTRTLATERVPLPHGVAIGVVDSGQRHEHASGAYRQRRQECEEAARLLGVRALRDVELRDLDKVAALPPPLDRRARHVVTEDQRVLDAVVALRQGDLPRLAELIDASHASMRDDYAASTRELDRLVELARSVAGVHAARVTGGGFGGSIVLLLEPDSAAQAVAEVAERGRAIEGLAPQALVPRPRGS